ncbi:uncharacterized protein LOC128198306 [Bicyclus anynana]|uniref:Uncharacterized protein LOC128198306 n=1 Tax=Bicyclus anynana TaxID=110368 RepID=A0ABM3LID0_BICAN|nr:uncharacterized protein LOC128198306 [Bicyclus anynana]
MQEQVLVELSALVAVLGSSKVRVVQNNTLVVVVQEDKLVQVVEKEDTLELVEEQADKLEQVHISYGLNSMCSGDLKRISNKLIKKTSHHTPVIKKIKPKIPKLPNIIPPVLPSKLSKPSLIKGKHKCCLPKLIRLRKLSKLPNLPKPLKIPKLPLIPPLIPLIPKLPLLPILPILPPIPLLPPLPLLPPILPKLPKALKPIRVPMIGKSGLKALGSQIKPITVPAPNSNRRILEKLKKLKKSGSLTTSEFVRFKKLLLTK